MDRPHLLFVTGKLAETALRHTLQDLAPRAGFDCSVTLLPILSLPSRLDCYRRYGAAS